MPKNKKSKKKSGRYPITNQEKSKNIQQDIQKHCTGCKTDLINVGSDKDIFCLNVLKRSKYQNVHIFELCNFFGILYFFKEKLQIIVANDLPEGRSGRRFRYVSLVWSESITIKILMTNQGS